MPPIHVQNQGGLLDVVAHPDFEQNGWIFITYSKRQRRSNGAGADPGPAGRQPYVVEGGGFHETWQGNLLAGGLRAQRILRLVIEDQEVVHAEELLLHAVGRIRDVRQGPDGHIYVVADERDGAVYRLEAVD